MQHYRILMRELENGVALGEPDLEIPSFGIDIACLRPHVLPFDFVNTSGQKPCTLHAHFI